MGACLKNMMKSVKREPFFDGPTILNVFKVKKMCMGDKSKNMLPLIFKVKVKKNSEPVFCNSIVMKEQFPNLLLNFLEQRVKLKGDKLNFEEQSAEKRAQSKSESKVEKKVESEVEESEEENAVLIKKKIEARRQKSTKQIVTQRKTRDSKDEKQGQKRRESLTRTPGDRKWGKSTYNTRRKKEVTVQDESLESYLAEKKLKQINTEAAVHKGILDYDYFVDSMGYVNLVSPAVIPYTPMRPDATKEHLTYLQPSFLDFNEDLFIEPESLHDSDCSEFNVKNEGEKPKRKSRTKQILKKRPINKNKSRRR